MCWEIKQIGNLASAVGESRKGATAEKWKVDFTCRETLFIFVALAMPWQCKQRYAERENFSNWAQEGYAA
jgi:hypothetical protein